MAEFDVKTGYDSWVSQDQPTVPNATGRFLAIRGGGSGQFRPVVHMPLAMSRIAGRTILSATLSVPVQGFWVNQTVTLQAFATSWNDAKITWGGANAAPAVTGATASSGATGALAAGQRIEFDVTALLQAIADGQPNYGWRLVTSQSTDRSTLRGFDSGLASWTLHVEVSDLLPKPVNLAPTGVIGVAKPTLIVDDLESLSAIQVQIDSAANPLSVDFDSGWRAATTPQLDLSAGMGRTVAVSTTNGSPTITFAANLVETVDIGATITGTGIPGGATIIARPTTTTATLSANATATGSITATVTRNYAGLSNGSTTYWRTRLKTVNGSVSAWSDWVDITREDKPAIVMDNPAGSTLWDPTPTIAAHLSPAGDDETRWQVIVHAVGDATDVRYNSGDDVDGAALEHTIPLRWKGRKVFPTDGDYRLIVKAWDRTDRVPSPGDTAFVRQSLTVTMDVDGAVTPPAGLTAVQATSGYPNVVLGWTRASDPDRFVVRRNGEVIRRLDPNDIRTAPGVFQWTDEHAPPNVTHTYTVRAITDVSGTLKQSVSCAPVDIFAEVAAVWLRWDGWDVELAGPDETDKGIEAEQVDKRQSFELPYRDEDVDIITALGGLKGAFKGTIDNRNQDDVEATAAALEALRQTPAERVRLVWFTKNIPIDLKSLSVAPDPSTLLPRYLCYAVKFGFSELPEPDDD